MSKHSKGPKTPNWDTVFLICKACGKRGSGPKVHKPKAIAAAVRQQSKDERPRPRIMFTSCMGLCPKAATAVARVGGDQPASIAPVRSPRQLAKVFPMRIVRIEPDESSEAAHLVARAG
ncbi:hypothetical protein BH10PSE17_BH10PSE17_09770 [soil metagenome]